MDIDTLGWKGKQVRHVDGREGTIIREYINFDYCDCTVKLADGTRTSFTLCANEDHKKAAGWSWFCKDFSDGPCWLEFAPTKPVKA